MCCESCPKYEECAIKDKLSDNCCDTCPDYYTCYGNSKEEKEEHSEWDY